MEIENLKLQKQIDELIDKIYPIGSYYETSDGNFDPNEMWGGTWKRDTNGYVTVGCQDPDESGITFEDNDRLLINAGATKGEVNHTLTVSEMPKHRHGMYYAQDYGNTQHDVFSYQGYLNNKTITDATEDVGGSQSHNNIQPSIGVYRWHRAA